MATDHNFKVKKGLHVLGTEGIYLTDTNTRIAEGSGNSVRIITSTGHIDIGSMNSGWVHMQANKNIYILPSSYVSIDGNLQPYTDSARTLGSNGTRWSHTYTDNVTVTDNIALGGTISGGTTITSSGNITTSGGSFIGTSGHVQTAGAYFSGDIRVLNNAGDGWNVFADRTNGKYVLSAITTVNVDSGYLVGGTAVINSSRGLTNITSGNIAGNLTIDYTGNSTNDAGLYVANDNSDWGIYVNKDGTATYGMKIAADGSYAFQITNSSGAEKFRVDGGGGVTAVGNLTIGNSSTAARYRAHWNDGSYMDLEGYGLSMNRSSSYIRPTTDGDKYLYIGGADASLDWNAIHFRSANGLYMTGTQFLDTNRNLVNIGTINTGQGATEVYLMNQNVRSSDSPTFQDLTVQGNLNITGDINSYNVTDLDVVDKTITLGVGGTASANDGGGIVVDGANAKLTWNNTNSYWQMNKKLAFNDTATTSNQGLGLVWTAFDKEGTTDSTDSASIVHTTNAGGHAGSVLYISAQNDANDGIAFVTNASSYLKHNSNTIWTAGNDGTGSGLDADLLDGQHGSYYRNASNINAGTLSSARMPSTPPNTYIYGDDTLGAFASSTFAVNPPRMGFFNINNSSTENPAGFGYWQGLHFRHNNQSSTWGWQLAGTYNTSYSDLYWRQVSNGSRGSWYKLWHTGNDGSSSGLDADLLDGQHGSYYARKTYWPDATTRLGLTTHSLTTLNTTALWSQPAGYQTMVRASNSNGLPSSHGQSYFGYTVTSRRDTGGGYSALLTAYDNSNMWFTYQSASTAYPTWRKLWHDGNDGSGSGLDADTLDGQQGSYYLNYNNLTNKPTIPSSSSFVDLSSTQTITGTKTFDGSSTAPWRVHVSNANNSWDALTFQSTLEWGDASQYGVLGGDGSEGLMLRKPHVVWNSAQGAADIRLGRSGGTSSGKWVGMGVKGSNVGFLSMESTNVLTWDTSNNVNIPNGNLTRASNTVWDAGNDGSGSGLDADTLDGINSGSFLRSDANDSYAGTLTINGMDFKTSNVVRNLKIQASSGGSDVGISGFRADGTHGFQIYGDGSNYGFLDANWANWDLKKVKNGQLQIDEGSGLNKVWSAGNDGSGSGLDADILDGQHGSYYNTKTYTSTGNAAGSYLGGHYSSGGNEKPNSSTFGSGKFKIAMLSSSNLGFGGSWNDVFWNSSYNGGDVKKSTALVSSKYDNTSLWIVKQNYDSSSWGTGYLFWNSGNDGSGSGLDADTVDGIHGSSFVRSDAADTLTGALTMNVGGNAITISSAAPQIRFNDTDHYDHWIHVNSNRFYILSDRDANGSWETPYPMELNSGNNIPYLFGNKAWTAGNDGSGSGLDADTLDGINSASFARSDAGTTYSNYGNLQRFYSNTNMATASGSQAGLECFSSGAGNDAFMTFHVGGDYAVYFGLDGGSNRLSTGGWSDGAVSNTVWHAGSDGSGSGLDADTLDGQQGSYYAPNTNIVHKNANTMTGSSFKLGFHSGAGGTTFNANHYSMGVDIANGSWSGNNYSDLIIGYHTGIRIGAGYSGIRFYNNSPTTDTNNDGNGDGSESLLMTIGGGGTTTSGAHVTVENNLYVKDNLYVGAGGNDGYFYSDTNGRTAFANGDFYIQNSVGNYYNYATNQYIGDSSGDNIYFRGNTLTGNSWSLSGAGALSAATITATGSFRADRFEDQGGAFFWREGLTSGRHRHLNLADTTSDPASVTDSNNPTGISWGQRTDNNGYYMFGLKGQYNNGYSSHSRLSIGWHTGIEIGASATYGGVRFMADSPFVNTTQIFGIGDIAGGHSRIGASKKLFFNGGTGTYGIGAGGHNYNSGYFDTVESGLTNDTLELVYYSGVGVNVGQGGAKPLGCSEIRFNANTTNRKISSTSAFYSNHAGVRIHGNWNEFEVMGRVLDVSGSNCHFMDGYGSTNHASHYFQIGTGSGGNGGLSYVRIGTTLNVDGDVVAYYSDARLKQNVETIPNALEILKGIRGVTFEWNKKAESVWKKKEGDKDFGMIAQEVDAVFPMGTVVQGNADKNKEMGYADPDSPNYDPLHDGERDEPEYKTIKYDKMVTLAIQAIKEQQEQIEELKQQIKDLQGQK